MPSPPMLRRARVLAAAAAGVLGLSLAALPGGAATGAVLSATDVSAAVDDAVVTVGEPQVLSGRTDGGARTVVAELRTPSGPVELARGRSAADGSFALEVPATWLRSGALRVAVPAEGLRAAGASPWLAARVRPAYVPRGSRSSWRPLDAVRARWNPCEVITWAVNRDGMPQGALTEVRRAFAEAARATGLTFREAGTTSALPWSVLDVLGWAEEADLVIAWSGERAVPGLRGTVLGLGGGEWWQPAGGEATYRRGGVVLDRDVPDHVVRGFGRGTTTGALLLHEIGHVVGLGHVRDRDQLMHPVLQPTARGRYEAGDLSGLAALGLGRGCTD